MPGRFAAALSILVGLQSTTALANPPAAPRIDTIAPAGAQPHSSDPAVIWYDDFEQDRLSAYLEPGNGSPDARRSLTEGLGGAGASMECHYPKGSRGIGNRKLVFGDSPFGKPIRAGEKFTDIYWRFYVKHQRGWTGAPAKLSRATGFVSPAWNQAFISHVWSSGLPLTLDPASGVQDGQVVTRVYNDFDRLHWLGNKPIGRFPIHATEESGRWVCVESRVKLNTPGRKDAVAELWVDGILDTIRTNLDFCGTYTGRGASVNAIFLEAYWNDGSPKDQYRWYDDFVVSTKPVGPLTADPNPTLLRLVDAAPEKWELQIAADPQGAGLVWKSRTLPGADTRVRANQETGTFVGLLAHETSLPAGPMYFCRARQCNTRGEWSEWSTWHQPFFVTGAGGPTSARLRLDRGSPGLKVEALGQSSASYALAASTDLQAWSWLAEATLPTGWCEWPLAPATQSNQFFRVRRLPVGGNGVTSSP